MRLQYVIFVSKTWIKRSSREEIRPGLIQEFRIRLTPSAMADFLDP